MKSKSTPTTGPTCPPVSNAVPQTLPERPGLKAAADVLCAVADSGYDSESLEAAANIHSMLTMSTLDLEAMQILLSGCAGALAHLIEVKEDVAAMAFVRGLRAIFAEAEEMFVPA